MVDLVSGVTGERDWAPWRGEGGGGEGVAWWEPIPLGFLGEVVFLTSQAILDDLSTK